MNGFFGIISRVAVMDPFLKKRSNPDSFFGNRSDPDSF